MSINWNPGMARNCHKSVVNQPIGTNTTANRNMLGDTWANTMMLSSPILRATLGASHSEFAAECEI